MARLQYADPNAAEIRALVDRVVAERGSVLHLYQMLLHSPPVAEGWLTFLTAVRQKSRLSGAMRELVIMRIAILNGAPYEAEQHAPIALKEGLTQAQLDSLADWSSSERFTPAQRAVLALTDSMTRDVHVDDAVFDAVHPHFSARELVELVVTIASYNMVSRVLEALQIGSQDSRQELRRDARSSSADAGSEPTGGLQRVIFLPGMVLSADELETEQHYVRARLRRHNRHLWGSGVVDGLGVRLSGASGAQWLTIEPGFAIDARGEEIEVASAVTQPLPAKGTELLVQLGYAERLVRPVPAPDPGFDELRASRVEETFRVHVAPDAKPVSVVIARLLFARGRWAPDQKYKVPRARGTSKAK